MSWRGETEDGSGWGGLVPTKAEREAEAIEERRLIALQTLRDVNAELIEALKEIAAIEDLLVGSDWEEIEQARVIARAALSKALGEAK